jgi:hypothetical protein
MNGEENFVEKLQRQSTETLQKLREIKKRDKKSNRILQIFGLCSLGLQKEVHHFCLLFILLLPFKDLFRCLILRKLLKQLEKTTKIVKKL